MNSARVEMLLVTGEYLAASITGDHLYHLSPVNSRDHQRTRGIERIRCTADNSAFVVERASGDKR